MSRKIYVRKKSEVTTWKEFYEQEQKCPTYRIRVDCGCSKPNNVRSGILVIHPLSYKVMCYVIRCKGCKNREEAANDR